MLRCISWTITKVILLHTLCRLFERVFSYSSLHNEKSSEGGGFVDDDESLRTYANTNVGEAHDPPEMLSGAEMRKGEMKTFRQKTDEGEGEDQCEEVCFRDFNKEETSLVSQKENEELLDPLEGDEDQVGPKEDPSNRVRINVSAIISIS